MKNVKSSIRTEFTPAESLRLFNYMKEIGMVETSGHADDVPTALPYVQNLRIRECDGGDFVFTCMKGDGFVSLLHGMFLADGRVVAAELPVFGRGQREECNDIAVVISGFLADGQGLLS